MDVSLVFAGIIGMVAGAILTYVWGYSEKQQTRVPETPAPAVSSDIAAVLAVLRSSAVILDAEGQILQASAPAHALGLIGDHQLRSTELKALAAQVRRDGVVREETFTIDRRRRAPAQVFARVAPLSGGLILALVDDRTREHQIEALRRDFVANVSHELKTPIGAIDILAEAVAEARDDPAAVARFSARMLVESERLTRLVQQVIDLSRIQADETSGNRIVVRLADLTLEAVEHSAIDAESQGIRVLTDADPTAHVLADRAQLASAMSNLVANAITYSSEGATVSVTVRRVGSEIEFAVADTGIGIGDEEVARVFERFYRVDPARARSTGGTGLGLSIVKHVAASNGGRVDVWSQPEVGSTFTLVLPAWDAEGDDGDSGSDR